MSGNHHLQPQIELPRDVPTYTIVASTTSRVARPRFADNIVEGLFEPLFYKIFS